MHAAKNGVPLVQPASQAPRALPAVVAVVTLPALAEQANGVSAPLAEVKTLRVGRLLVPVVAERQESAADTEDRLARVDELDEVLHLLVGQLEVHREDDHHVGRLKEAHARYVGLDARIDSTVLRVDREEHRALEPVTPGQDLRDHGQGLFASILPLAADEDDVLAPASAALARLVGYRSEVLGFGGR